MSFLPDHALDHLRHVAETPDLSATRYQVQDELGRGGMGIVYQAWDSQLERLVALKVMDAGHALHHEAKVLAQLEHPGLVPVYDAGALPDGRVYYAMRLVRGRRLDQFLSGEPSVPARLRLFEKVCEAVAFAHDRGVIHCDLKPQNIMVGAFGEVFVMDWGVARRLDAASTAITAGTPGYMAPEQSRQSGHTVDARADIFALGRILLELASPGNARPLVAIAQRATAPDPAARYATVQHLAEDVTRHLDGHPVTAYHETPIEQLARFWRRNHVLLLLLTTYLAVKLLLYFWPWR